MKSNKDNTRNITPAGDQLSPSAYRNILFFFYHKWQIPAIILITFITLYPSIHNGFTNWDDYHHLLDNEKIKTISWKNFILTIKSGASAGSYVTWALEYTFFKFNPLFFHLDNILLHIINITLLYYFFLLLSENDQLSFWGTILFSIHPMHIEPANWITGRSWLLCSIFFILALHFYARYIIKNKSDTNYFFSDKYYWFVMVSFILALLSQSIAITLPAILFLLDYFLKRKFHIKLLLEKVPFFLLTVFSVWLMIQVRHDKEPVMETYTFIDRLLMAGYSFTFHLYKIFIPTDLTSFYPLLKKVHGNLPYYYYSCLILSAILVFIVFYFSKYNRIIFFAFCFYIISIAPVLRLVPVNSSYLMADRYTYLSHIGIFYFIGWGITFLHSLQNQIVKKTLRTLLFLICIVMGYISWEKSKVWKDSVSLWSDVIEKYPNSLTAWYDRGNAYMEMKEMNKAISDFTRAIEIDKNFIGAYNNRGNAYSETGQFELAIKDFSILINSDPANDEYYYNRGKSFGQQGKLELALLDFNNALELNPDNIEVYNNRGIVYSLLGKYPDAVVDFTYCIKSNPDNAEAIYNRSIAYFYLENFELALQDITVAKNKGIDIQEHLLENIKQNIK